MLMLVNSDKTLKVFLY